MTSVIIVTYNNSADILDCLNGLPWKSHHLDVIVSENASTDSTRQKITKWQDVHKDLPVRLLSHSENLGYAEGVNVALKCVRGQSILLLGPDTRMTEGALDILSQRLEQKPVTGIIAPQLLNHDGSVQQSCRRFPEFSDLLIEMTGLPRLFPNQFKAPWKMDDFDHKSPKFVDQPEASCLLIRKEALEQVGPMDTRFPLFFNDVDLCRRFSEKGWKIYFEPEAKVFHIGGSSVKQLPVFSIFKSHQAFFRYFEKYTHSPWKRPGLIPIGFLLVVTGTLRALGTAFLRKKKPVRNRLQ